MRFFYLLVATLTAWATIYVGGNQAKDSAVAWSAYALVAIAAAIQVFTSLAAGLGPSLPLRKRHASNILRNRLAAIHEQQFIRDGFTLTSMHVWMVPVAYRVALPFRFRRWLRRLINEDLCEKYSVKPRLTRVAVFGLKDHESTGVSFRKGYGLVGRCLAENGSAPLYVDFADSGMSKALEAGANEWRRSATDITHGLKFSDAKQIADRYSQSVARVVSDPDSREALGVVTLEVRSGFKPKLKDNQDLVQHLNEVAAILAPVLAIRKVTR